MQTASCGKLGSRGSYRADRGVETAGTAAHRYLNTKVFDRGLPAGQSPAMADLVTTFTPQEAAEHVGCGRSSIMRALADKHLPGIRDNAGKWRIRLPDLDRWAANRPVTNHQPQGQRPASSPDTVLDTPVTAPSEQLDALRQERDEARLEAAVLHAEATQLRERLDEAQTQFRERLNEAHGRLDDVQADRDHWRRFAAGLSEAKPRPRRGFLDRLLGRGEPHTV